MQRNEPTQQRKISKKKKKGGGGKKGKGKGIGVTSLRMEGSRHVPTARNTAAWSAARDANCYSSDGVKQGGTGQNRLAFNVLHTMAGARAYFPE